MNWKTIEQEEPEDDGIYLVIWKNSGNIYGLPHKAYYCSIDKKFFSLETNSSFPLAVDLYTKIPNLPDA